MYDIDSLRSTVKLLYIFLLVCQEEIYKKTPFQATFYSLWTQLEPNHGGIAGVATTRNGHRTTKSSLIASIPIHRK